MGVIGVFIILNFIKSIEYYKNADAWEQAERRWGFDYAVMEYDLKDRRFPLHLNSNPDWALIYWDNHSAVYLKRTKTK